jgi:L-ascorbate metabolism protein UlaG (beta-lactamase superfamily)
MSNRIRLTGARWLLIRTGDLQDAGTFAPAGGRVKCAAPQGVCYAPGTIRESEELAALLLGIGKAMPTSADVKGALFRSAFRGTHYELQEDGNLWYVRCISAHEDPQAAFQCPTWKILLELGGRWLEVAPSDGAIVEVLELFSMLNGDHQLFEVAEFCASQVSQGCARLFGLLAEIGLLDQVPQADSLSRLPDLIFLGHAGFAVRSGDEFVLFDPMLVPANSRLGDVNYATLLGRASAVVLSHCHWDHVHAQTLVRVPRSVPIFVPRRHGPPSLMNPSVADYLRALGFRDVREHNPEDEVSVGEIEIRFWPFHGEPFGLDSAFDGLTYTVEARGRRIFGAVDAMQNEVGDMERTIARVAETGPVDLFLFGATGQRHDPLFAAAGYRHFSNELENRPELHRYHPDVRDVLRWAERMRPRLLVPYADFRFGVTCGQTYKFDNATARPKDAIATLETVHEGEEGWVQSLRWLHARSQTPVLRLRPSEGIRFG